jgi:hypothetical protein
MRIIFLTFAFACVAHADELPKALPQQAAFVARALGTLTLGGSFHRAIALPAAAVAKSVRGIYPSQLVDERSGTTDATVSVHSVDARMIHEAASAAAVAASAAAVAASAAAVAASAATAAAADSKIAFLLCVPRETGAALAVTAAAFTCEVNSFEYHCTLHLPHFICARESISSSASPHCPTAPAPLVFPRPKAELDEHQPTLPLCQVSALTLDTVIMKSSFSIANRDGGVALVSFRVEHDLDHGVFSNVNDSLLSRPPFVWGGFVDLPGVREVQEVELDATSVVAEERQVMRTNVTGVKAVQMITMMAVAVEDTAMTVTSTATDDNEEQTIKSRGVHSGSRPTELVGFGKFLRLTAVAKDEGLSENDACKASARMSLRLVERLKRRRLDANFASGSGTPWEDQETAGATTGGGGLLAAPGADYTGPDTTRGNWGDATNDVEDAPEGYGKGCVHFPAHSPTRDPTHAPTRDTTREPTHVPTHEPTAWPCNYKLPSTQAPTRDPTQSLTHQPTHEPTRGPTKRLSHPPSHQPSQGPSRMPSKALVQNPTPSPSYLPSRDPTRGPSRMPTHAPSQNLAVTVTYHGPLVRGSVPQQTVTDLDGCEPLANASGMVRPGAPVAAADFTLERSFLPLYRVQTTVELAYDASVADVKAAVEAPSAAVDVEPTFATGPGALLEAIPSWALSVTGLQRIVNHGEPSVPVFPHRLQANTTSDITGGVGGDGVAAGDRLFVSTPAGELGELMVVDAVPGTFTLTLSGNFSEYVVGAAPFASANGLRRRTVFRATDDGCDWDTFQVGWVARLRMTIGEVIIHIKAYL